MSISTLDPARILNEVLASPKYRQIEIGLVQSIAQQEATRHRTVKEAVKATKNKLHQVAEVYFASRPDYAGWVNTLAQHAHDAEKTQEICRTIMGQHTSTRERLPILDTFYSTLFADLPPIHTLLDLACGFNPLAHGWMNLSPAIHYLACDIHQDQMTFLNQVWAVWQVNGQAFVHDLYQGAPTVSADVALLLKSLPCLEQIDKQISLRLLDSIQAPVIIVSFPRQSIGGQAKGMTAHYESHFRSLIAARPWSIERFEFETELVFRLFKN